MFGKSSPPIALDIGSYSVKLVQFERRKKEISLAHLGMASLEAGSVKDGTVQDHEEVMRAVDELLEGEKIKPKSVVVALSGGAAIVRTMVIPRMRGMALEEAVAAEAAQVLPYPLEEVRLSRRRFGKIELDGVTMDEFLLVAVRKEPLEELVELLRHLKLEPRIVDVNMLALESALELAGLVRRHAVTALVDVGASTTLVHILRGRKTLLARNIPLGGDSVTNALAARLGVPPFEAECIKLGTEPPPSPRAVAEALREEVERLCRELGRTFQLLSQVRPEEQVDRVILSGGGAQLDGLTAFMAASLDLPVELSDPFRKLKVPDDRFDLGYVEMLAPVVTVAAGLAYRALDAA